MGIGDLLGVLGVFLGFLALIYGILQRYARGGGGGGAIVPVNGGNVGGAIVPVNGGNVGVTSTALVHVPPPRQVTYTLTPGALQILGALRARAQQSSLAIELTPQMMTPPDRSLVQVLNNDGVLRSLGQILGEQVVQCDIVQFFQRWIEVRSRHAQELSATLGGSHRVFLQAFDAGTRAVLAWYGRLLLTEGEVAIATLVSTLRGIAGEARGGSAFLGSFVSEMETVTALACTLSGERITILRIEHQKSLDAGSASSRLAVVRTCLMGRLVLLDELRIRLAKTFAKSCKLDPFLELLDDLVRFVERGGFAGELGVRIHVLRQQVDEGQRFAHSVRYSSKETERLELVFVLSTQSRSSLNNPSPVLDLDWVIDELEDALQKALRPFISAKKKKDKYDAEREVRWKKQDEKAKLLEASNTNDDVEEEDDDAPPQVVALPPHEQIPNHTTGAFEVWVRIDWTSVQKSSSHGRKIFKSDTLRNGYIAAMRNGYIASTSTGESGVKIEPGGIYIVKVSYPDAQPLGADNTVSLIARKVDPGGGGKLMLTFTSAEKRH